MTIPLYTESLAAEINILCFLLCIFIPAIIFFPFLFFIMKLFVVYWKISANKPSIPPSSHYHVYAMSINISVTMPTVSYLLGNSLASGKFWHLHWCLGPCILTFSRHLFCSFFVLHLYRYHLLIPFYWATSRRYPSTTVSSILKKNHCSYFSSITMAHFSAF